MISHRYLLPSGELCPAAHDHPAVRAALSPHSLAVMEARYRDGRVDEPLMRLFRFLWSWSAPRFSHMATAHERAWARLGLTGYWRRISRVRSFVARCRAALAPEPRA